MKKISPCYIIITEIQGERNFSNFLRFHDDSKTCLSSFLAFFSCPFLAYQRPICFPDKPEGCRPRPLPLLPPPPSFENSDLWRIPVNSYKTLLEVYLKAKVQSFNARMYQEADCSIRTSLDIGSYSGYTPVLCQVYHTINQYPFYVNCLAQKHSSKGQTRAQTQRSWSRTQCANHQVSKICQKVRSITHFVLHPWHNEHLLININYLSHRVLSCHIHMHKPSRWPSCVDMNSEDCYILDKWPRL